MTAKALRALRRRMGLTQQEFATLTRVTRNSIARMERGRQTITGAMGLVFELVAKDHEALDRQRSGRRAGGQRINGGKARASRGQDRPGERVTSVQKRRR